MAFTRSCNAHELPRGLNDGSPRRSCSFFTTRRAILQAAASSGSSTAGVAAYPGIVRWNEIGCASPLGGPAYARSPRGLATMRVPAPSVFIATCSLLGLTRDVPATNDPVLAPATVRLGRGRLC